ncbi:hypothetical protein OG226_23960 [Streptomyces sp. NBC_01261]|uniref:hypothetical protein n=1 Tax=unclassified Streptomyces TaxID=2593676 RepID=UPI002E2DB5F5|nr:MULTISPECIES: hypothetical protein [unclassified Streptomyces]
MIESREARTALVVESVLSTAAVVWWTYLLWPWWNVPYARPDFAMDLAVAVSLAVTWALWVRGRRLNSANLALIVVRGVAVLTVCLWILQDL